jgi:hypothetical protein
MKMRQNISKYVWITPGILEKLVILEYSSHHLPFQNKKKVIVYYKPLFNFTVQG